MSQVPTQTAVSTDDLRVFPEDLVCGKRRDSLNEHGPSWMNITIGKSTLADVRELLLTFGIDYEFIDDDYNTRFLDPTVYHETEFPDVVSFCLLDKTIEVMAVWFDSPLSIPRPNLSDFVVQYGLPDTISWTDNPATRVIFWFKHGLAIVVNVIPNDMSRPDLQPTFGRVIEEIYFPYQDVEGYEDRWPYNQTRPFNQFIYWPSEGLNDYGPENPFVFNTLLATMTPHLSRTPTSAFTTLPLIPTVTITP